MAGKQHPPVLRRLGQNFLTDPSILARIADALELTGNERVVEIGAGRGALTEQLASRCRHLAAIEIDRMLVPILRERFFEHQNVEIVEGDALAIPLSQLGADPFRLIGNVPYYITTPLIFRALAAPRPDLAVFLVQKEVAERAAAPPGSKTYGALSVNIQAFAEAEILFSVPAGAFTPRPKVDSAVLRLRPFSESRRIVPEENEASFKNLVQSAFAQRRKQLRRILRSTYGLSVKEADDVLRDCALDPEGRPETLRAADFAVLGDRVRGAGYGVQGTGYRER